MTLGYWEFEPGITLPEHSHPHEQVSNIIDGVFEFTINGNIERLESGSAAVIPPDMPHSGKSITKCHIIDVFYPVREDFK
jgi:quercetin dioxygenase-like cupin family protein